jgi:hypothetical protein
MSTKSKALNVVLVTTEPSRLLGKAVKPVQYYRLYGSKPRCNDGKIEHFEVTVDLDIDEDGLLDDLFLSALNRDGFRVAKLGGRIAATVTRITPALTPDP